MRFAKMQGVGNDFVVFSSHDVSDVNLAELAIKLCERRFSVGADGLLVIGPSTDGCAISFRMFNPDGTEDMCGNGLRCAALWAHRNRLVNLGKFDVSTKDGRRSCDLLTADSNHAIVTVDMGTPRFESADIPIDFAGVDFINQPIQVLDFVFQATAVNTGSTHSVVFLSSPLTEKEFFKYSPAFENHPLFPDRTSVMWTVKTGPSRFEIRIWERGAGETLGCGTGACATAAAAVVNKRANKGDNIVVSSKGGDLTIHWTETLRMTGPATLVFEGAISG